MIGKLRDQICPTCRNVRSSHAPRCTYEASGEAAAERPNLVIEGCRQLGFVMLEWQERVARAVLGRRQ